MSTAMRLEWASQAADEMLEVAELEASQLPPEWVARSYAQPLALKQAAQLRAAYVSTCPTLSTINRNLLRSLPSTDQAAMLPQGPVPDAVFPSLDCQPLPSCLTAKQLESYMLLRQHEAGRR